MICVNYIPSFLSLLCFALPYYTLLYFTWLYLYPFMYFFFISLWLMVSKQHLRWPKFRRSSSKEICNDRSLLHGKEKVCKVLIQASTSSAHLNLIPKRHSRPAFRSADRLISAYFRRAPRCCPLRRRSCPCICASGVERFGCSSAGTSIFSLGDWPESYQLSRRGKCRVHSRSSLACNRRCS